MLFLAFRGYKMAEEKMSILVHLTFNQLKMTVGFVEACLKLKSFVVFFKFLTCLLLSRPLKSIVV